MEWMDPSRRFAGFDAATIANNHLNDLGWNNDGKSWNFPSYLYQREIQPVEPVSLERSDFEERQERSGKQEEEDGILEYDSPSGNDDIPSLEREAVIAIWYLKRFPLQKKYTLQQQNCVRLIFLISVAMELLLFVSLKLTCLYIHVCPWSKFNKRKSLPWLAYVIRARLWKLLTWTISSFWWKR